jgi:hypothetical protein
MGFLPSLFPAFAAQFGESTLEEARQRIQADGIGKLTEEEEFQR